MNFSVTQYGELVVLGTESSFLSLLMFLFIQDVSVECPLCGKVMKWKRVMEVASSDFR